jgi:hypothetical protein
MLATRIHLCLLFAAVTPSFCSANITRLSADDQKALRDVSRFHELHAAKDLPPAVLALCAGESGKLADPGQKWQATDVITDQTLPGKRLIWAVTNDDYYVVHYERGGIAHSFHVMVARLKAGESKPSFVWRGVGKQLDNFKAFLEALRNNKLDDSLNYPH